MKSRSGLPKKLRFEIFKRDKFTCKYCGNRPPDVVLVADHVQPYSRGGPTNLLNLVTSCEDCNQGKGARRLDDDAVLRAQYSELDRRQERLNQIKMMAAWECDLKQNDDNVVTEIASYWESLAPGWSITPDGRRSLYRLIDKFEFSEILAAMRAASRYLRYDQDGKITGASCYEAYQKVEKIARVERDSKTNPNARVIAFAIGILKRRIKEMDNARAERFISAGLGWGMADEEIFHLSKTASSLDVWCRLMNVRMRELKRQQKPNPIGTADTVWDMTHDVTAQSPSPVSVTYQGTRENFHRGERVVVTRNGLQPYDLPMRGELDHPYWGYPGGGPLDLGLLIVADYLGLTAETFEKQKEALQRPGRCVAESRLFSAPHCWTISGAEVQRHLDQCGFPPLLS